MPYLDRRYRDPAKAMISSLPHHLGIKKKLVASFGLWSFVRHIELKMAAILGHGPWTPIYGHVIYHFVGNFMLIQNHITIMGNKCTGE